MTMKVLFLNNFNYVRGGSEVVFFEEMKMLQKNNHETTVFSRANDKNQKAEYEDYFPPAIDTEQLGLNLRAFSTVKELIYSSAAKAGLGSVIQSFAPDIAHAHNIYGRLSLSVLDKLKEREIPTVLTLHDLKLICPSYLMLSHGAVCEKCKGDKFYHAVFERCHKNSIAASTVYALETWINHLFKKYDAVKYFIAPSNFLRNKLIEHGWSSEKIVYIPNFVDTSKIKPTIGAGEYFLYIGRLSHEKGVKTLLKAMAGIKFKYFLKVVGDGPERASLERIAAELGVNVQFTGYLNGSALQDALSRAKVVIMPSECYENAPLSLLEAFSYGKPVIGARIGGIPEMIDDGVNGFLFESGDVNDLRAKIDAFLSLTEKEASEMGKKAREKVDDKYSPDVHYTKLLKVYSATSGRQLIS